MQAELWQSGSCNNSFQCTEMIGNNQPVATATAAAEAKMGKSKSETLALIH